MIRFVTDRLAIYWRDEVANVRLHQTTKQRPLDRFEQERDLLRPLPAAPFETDELVSAIVNSHARVKFDGNRYSTPPEVEPPPTTTPDRSWNRAWGVRSGRTEDRRGGRIVPRAANQSEYSAVSNLPCSF